MGIPSAVSFLIFFDLCVEGNPHKKTVWTLEKCAFGVFLCLKKRAIPLFKEQTFCFTTLQRRVEGIAK